MLVLMCDPWPASVLQPFSFTSDEVANSSYAEYHLTHDCEISIYKIKYLIQLKKAAM